MLQEIRKRRGLSQSQLAERSGVNLRMIQHYEQGYKSIDGAALKTLCKLSQALDCRLWEILNDPQLAEAVQRQTVG